MNSAPPPPPHNEVPKGSGLPPGKYDIFIIPPHSSGSGFLYLPSLQPNINSFIAGFASALVLVALGSMIGPAFRSWWYNVKSSGGIGIVMIVLAVGLGAWAIGRTQTDGGPGPGGGGNAGSGTHSNSQSDRYPGRSTPGSGPSGEAPKTSWQRATPGMGPNGASTANGAAKGAWEKAREETKRKEDERKVKEAEKKRKEENDKKLREAREKEAKEREEREKRQRETQRKGGSYAFSATGEKTNPWPGAQPGFRSQPPSPTKRPPPPTAKTYLGTDDDAYSYRPYDKPKPTHKKSHSSLYSESSYAASQSTSRTTPPPSHRGPYHTKDPDKIVIKAVYAFNNAFLRTPTSQLVSGVGSVTDGLILRITTEGLFIDDDVRGVPQREWDVKAWTMKLVETGELKSARLHVLRASIRDAEGKRYMFVIAEEESWKVAVGLQRLRKGSQVRALGVSGMSAGDARGTLESLGWGSGREI